MAPLTAPLIILHLRSARTTIASMAAARANKRRYVRTRAQNLVAHLRVGDRTIQAPVDDISMGGMLARTNESIAIGTAVMFDLARPGLKKPLRLLGVVVDTRVGRGLGIRFDGLDREGADRLGELIKDLGGMTSSLLVDKPDDPRSGGGATPGPVPILPNAIPSITGSTTGVTSLAGTSPGLQAPSSGSFARPAPTGTFSAPSPTQIAQAQAAAHAAAASNPAHTELELKLQAQMRSMVLELGRLQEVVAQREKELQDARVEIDRLKADTASGDAAQRIVGKLEIEKNKLEAQLADVRTRARAEVDIAQREAEQAAGALNRMLESLKRLR
jgi:hypothetical protein